MNSYFSLESHMSIKWPVLFKEDWEIFEDMMNNRSNIYDVTLLIIYPSGVHPMIT